MTHRWGLQRTRFAGVKAIQQLGCNPAVPQGLPSLIVDRAATDVGPSPPAPPPHSRHTFAVIQPTSPSPSPSSSPSTPDPVRQPSLLKTFDALVDAIRSSPIVPPVPDFIALRVGAVYKSAGYPSSENYIAKAQSFGIVEIGEGGAGMPTRRWIRLGVRRCRLGSRILGAHYSLTTGNF